MSNDIFVSVCIISATVGGEYYLCVFTECLPVCTCVVPEGHCVCVCVY